MSYKIRFTSDIEKDARDISQPDLKKIKIQIEKKLAIDPYHFGKPLKYSFKGVRSLRVGNYRVLYTIIDDIVTIEAIDHRSDVYN